MLNPIWIVFLIPISLIFDNFKIPLFGTIDQFLTVAGVALVLSRSAIRKDNIKLINDRWIIPLFFAFTLIAIACCYNSPFGAFLSLYYVFTSWILKGLIVYLIMKSVRNNKDLILCYKSLIVSICIIILIMIYNVWLYGNPYFFRTIHFQTAIKGGLMHDILFTNPNELSRYLILTVPFILVFSFYLKNKQAALFARCICLAGVSIVFFGEGRAATVAMIIVVSVLTLKMKRKMITIVFVGIAILLFSSSLILGRFNEAVEKGLETGHRKELMETSLEIIRAHPLLGSGPRSDLEMMKEQQGPRVSYERVEAEHNYYLSTTVQYGILGLIVFILLILRYIRYLYLNLISCKNPILRDFMSAALLAFLGLSLTTFTGGTFDENIVWYVVGLSLSLVIIKRNENVAIRNGTYKYTSLYQNKYIVNGNLAKVR